VEVPFGGCDGVTRGIQRVLGVGFGFLRGAHGLQVGLQGGLAVRACLRIESGF
jgi:hypothetical protein